VTRGKMREYMQGVTNAQDVTKRGVFMRLVGKQRGELYSIHAVAVIKIVCGVAKGRDFWWPTCWQTWVKSDVGRVQWCN